jgi:hypothetical protein
MEKMLSRSLRVLLLASALSLGACGGGGGGNASGTDTGDTNQALAVKMRSDNLLLEDLQVGLPSNLVITGEVTDSPDTLQGKPLYASIEDSAGNFATATGVATTPVIAGIFDIKPQLKEGLTAGTYTGKLTAHVCLDDKCVAEVTGSPLQASYALHVVKGLELAQNTLDVTVAAGSPAFSRTIAVTFPNGETVDAFSASATPADPAITVQAATSPGGLTGVLTVNFSPAAAGVRTSTVQVSAAKLHGNTTSTYTQQVLVTYTATP